jgi:transposase
MQQLAEYIKQNNIKPSGGRLTGADIHLYIKEEFDQEYHPDHVYNVLKKLNFSWITSRSKHPKQSQKAQDEFKKTAD